MIKIGKEESLKLAYGDLEHIVNNLYALAESHQEVTQKNIVSALNVAREMAKRDGGFSFIEDKVRWKAVNQYTKAISPVELPRMQIGDTWLGQNSTFEEFTPMVDPIQEALDVTCTVFQRMNNKGDMLRVATNVRRSDGARAIGTYIPAINPDGSPNPVISKILSGETFKGRAYVVNDWYISAYEPIFDKNLDIVGVLYVGIPQENVSSLRNAFMEMKIGKAGYVTVIDSTGDTVISYRGETDKENVMNAKDAKGKHYIEERIQLALELNDSEIGEQQFSRAQENDQVTIWDARFVYFTPWDWIITAEADESNFTEVAKQLSALGFKGNIIIAVAATIILLCTGVLWYFTAKSITKPVKKLAEVFEEYANGNTEVRAEVNSTDEIGYFAKEFNALLNKINSATKELKQSEATYKDLFNQLQETIESNNYRYRFSSEDVREDLAVSLNDMLESLDFASKATAEQTWLKSGEAELNAIISSERDIMTLAQQALTFIAKHVGAKVGTFFLKEQDTNTFKLLTNYAFREREDVLTSFKPGEGLAGQAALEHESIIFSEVPEDYIRVESSLGNIAPKYLIAIPLVYENDVKGVIELGTVKALTKLELDFIDLAAKILAVAMNTAIFNETLEKLLTQTRKQAQVLEEQQEELKAANEELQEHTEVLKNSEAKLQLQQEELQASNEELEEKTEILEQQKSEIAEKNSILRKKQIEVEEKARQLELATKYKSEFLANMSHELRTPLNSLLILASLLAENEEGNLNSDQMESAEAIHKGGQNLLRLINDILDLSKIEARKIELSPSITYLENIGRNCIAEFEHMAHQKGLELEVKIAEHLPQKIFTDEHRLNQILRNLLGNAIKFTDRGKVKLEINSPAAGAVFKKSALEIESTIAFTVSDTGIGIAEENIIGIFEAFTQADGSISRKHGGTGLGLSISRELVLLLGGELGAESTVNQGSIFTLYIPEELNLARGGETLSPSSKQITDDSVVVPKVTSVHMDRNEEVPFESSKKVLKRENESKVAQKPRTILIIEDDQDFANILANFFSKNGYTTIIAPDGETGIIKIIEELPTAVLLDIGLPGIDGWAVLRELKGNPATRHIPVHILSAYDEPRQGLKQGAVGYLTKPIQKNDLYEVLSRIEGVLQEDVKKLLIVEDDDDLRSNLVKIMQTKDIHAETATTGNEALQMLRTSHFDCMILDLGLPDISGFDLLNSIQQSTELAKVPVIIYTGRDLSQEETMQLENYGSTIVLKNAASIDRLLDETALFMHRVEANIPEDQRQMIQKLRDKESVLSGKVVMVVDDDMRNALALNKLLKSKGMTTIVADNGQRALDILNDDQEPRPDIILMDIMMPVMDGYQAMEIIRTDPVHKDIPILALTAKAMGSDRQDCIDAGANDYLSKPVNTNKLLTMLRIWLYS